ncbi:MAG: hypothetical protein ACRDG4_14690, partial [Chloroflexota bacterium]
MALGDGVLVAVAVLLAVGVGLAVAVAVPVAVVLGLAVTVALAVADAVGEGLAVSVAVKGWAAIMPANLEAGRREAAFLLLPARPSCVAPLTKGGGSAPTDAGAVTGGRRDSEYRALPNGCVGDPLG